MRWLAARIVAAGATAKVAADDLVLIVEQYGILVEAEQQGVKLAGMCVGIATK